MIKGIDISHYQGNVDLNKVKDDVYFTTAQITFGKESDTPKERTNWANVYVSKMLESQMPLVGGYHWLLPGNIEAQVDWFIKRMYDLFGGIEGNICQLDAEFNNRLNVGPNFQDILQFCNIFNQKTQGYSIALYLPQWYWSNIGKPVLTKLPNVTLWQSDYRELPVEQKFNSYGFLKPKIVQFTSTGKIAGINGNCDVNVFNGTKQELYDSLTRPGLVAVDCEDTNANIQNIS